VFDVPRSTDRTFTALPSVVHTPDRGRRGHPRVVG
jgi:hypothetical protein